MADRNRRTRFADCRVEAIFDSYPMPARRRLLRLRDMIFDVAARTEGVGALEETLKWGQPSYLTAETKSGSTIRIDQVKSTPGRIALYVHCQTTLIGDFRARYPNQLRYQGNRGIVLDAADEILVAALRHCIALALIYHLRKIRA